MRAWDCSARFMKASALYFTAAKKNPSQMLKEDREHGDTTVQVWIASVLTTMHPSAPFISIGML